MSLGAFKCVRHATSLAKFDRDFITACKQRCHSQLGRIQRGVQQPLPRWNIPGKDVRSLKKAAVLVPLCLVNNAPALLLTLRSSQLRGHQGDVSFPGGKMDGSDTDLAHTALRETFEEIGLAGPAIDLWGYLEPLPSKNYGMIVTPVLAFCGDVDVDKLKVNKTEVDEVFASTLASLCDPRNVSYTTFRSGSFIYKLPVYTGQRHKIWGLTAMITHRILKIIAPEHYSFDWNYVQS